MSHRIHSMPDGFKPIPGYPGYFVSPDYEIWSSYFKVPRKLKYTLYQGYYVVCVMREGAVQGRCTHVHYLILLACKGNRPYPKAQARHLDGNPLNNHPDNLQWGTAKENAEDRDKHGRTVTLRGDDNPLTKLSDADVNYIYSLKDKTTRAALGEQFNVHYTTITRIWTRQRKAWLTKP